MKDWTKNLTDEQEKIMYVLSGFTDSIDNLMNILVSDFDEETSRIAKLSYIKTLADALNISINK